jgi:hypothetical protein
MKQVSYFLTLLFLFSLTAIVNAQDRPKEFNNLPEKMPATSEELVKYNFEKMQREHPNMQVQYNRTFKPTLDPDDFYVSDSYTYQSWNGTMWENTDLFTYTYNEQGWRTEYLHQEWSGGWVNDYRYTYTYNGNGTIAGYLGEDWNGSAWENFVRETYSYNANNQYTEILYESWSGSSWENSQLTLYEYFANGNLETQTYQLWSGGAWVNYSKYTYQYNANNLVIDVLVQSWSGGVWTNYRKYNYTYNANGDYVTYVVYDWTGSMWHNYYQYLYSYNGNGWRIEYIYQQGDAANNWINSSRLTYTYDGSENYSQILRYEWDGTNWANDHKGTYTYNGSGLLTDYFGEDWDSGSGWVNDTHDAYEYDTNDNNTLLTSQEWDGTQWVNTYRTMTTWLLIISDVKNDGNLVTEYSLENNYPNPFNPSTNIKFSVPSTSHVTIKVYDALGKEVAEAFNRTVETGIHEVQFNSNGLSSGVYFYCLEANEIDGSLRFNETKKMILMK